MSQPFPVDRHSIRQLCAIIAQHSLDYPAWAPASEYAAENLGDLLSRSTPAEARFQARFLYRKTLNNTPLAHDLTDWWLGNLEADKSAAAAAHLTELNAAFLVFPADCCALPAMIGAAKRQLEADMQTADLQAGARPEALRWLESDQTALPLYHAARDTLLASAAFPRLQQAGPDLRTDLALLSARLGDAELQERAGSLIAPLANPALLRLMEQAQRHPLTDLLQQAIVRTLARSVSKQSQAAPAAAWYELTQLRNHTSLKPHLAALPLADVFSRLAEADPLLASHEAAAGILSLTDSKERDGQLAQLADLTSSWQDTPALHFLAHLHGRIAGEADLLRPSRSRLLDRFSRTDKAVQLFLMDELCLAAPLDPLLRVALCKAKDKNSAPRSI